MPVMSFGLKAVKEATLNWAIPMALDLSGVCHHECHISAISETNIHTKAVVVKQPGAPFTLRGVVLDEARAVH